MAGADTARDFGNVLVNHEGLIFQHGRIFPQSFVAPMYGAHYRRPSRYAWFLIKNYGLRRGTVHVPSGLWVLDNFSPDAYHHWLIDCLPRVVLGETMHPDEHVLLLPRAYQRVPYVTWSLEAFPQIECVGWIPARSKLRVERLAFVPRPPVQLGRPSVYPPRDVREVAHRVGELAGEPGPARRIYFTRDDAARRRAKNEEDLVCLLRSYDFEIHRIDPGKPWEQVRASCGAEIMAGVHGAALSNLIFMEPGSTLLEFRRPEREDVFFFDTYRPLAQSAGVEYLPQICEPADEAPGYEINNADLIVDLDLLRATLDAL